MSLCNAAAETSVGCQAKEAAVVDFDGISEASAVRPRVSVVMPVYNGAVFLEAAVASVLAQSCPDFELVVVDDGSTDETPAILAQLAEGDARIRLLRKPNSGISDTLNAGIEAARGEWIARLDADDLMLPQRLERQLAFVDADPDLVAAGSYYEHINAAGELRGVLHPLPRNRAELERFLAAGEPLAFTHPTMIYRRDLARAIGGYDRAFEPCEDGHFFARMLASGGLILIQPEVLTRYRVHPGSISSRKMAQQFTMQRFIYHNFYAERAGRPPLTYEAYLAREQGRPVMDRLRTRLALASEYCYRAYTAARVEGRQAKAAVYLAAASSLRPKKALRRGLRGLMARVVPAVRLAP
jgi:glycosyltransferase involved in cell wall biosynthesis